MREREIKNENMKLGGYGHGEVLGGVEGENMIKIY